MPGLDFSSRAVQPQRPNFAAQASAQPMGAGQEIVRGLPDWLTQGATNFAGQFGDLPATARALAQRGVQFARAHGLNLPDAPSRLPGQPPPDYLGTAVGAIARKLGVDPNLARLVAAITTPADLINAPTSAQLQSTALHGRQPFVPQTTGGKYARTIAQYAPMVFLPASGGPLGQVLRRTANVAVPAVASETAGQLTQGSPYEPWARALAGLTAGALTTAATSSLPPSRILAEASRGASDQDIAAAQQRMAAARQQGVPLTLAEALQYQTGNATGLGRLQRVLEGTRQGDAVFGPMMAERPGQVRGALMDYADTVAPATDRPSMVGGAAQTAASGQLHKVRRLINFFAKPHYDALPGQEIPPAQYAPLGENPSYQAALSGLRGDPELGASVAHLPDNNAAVVNEVLKNLDAMAEGARPGPMNPGGNNTLAGLRDSAGGLANQIASAASPDFRAARDAVAAGRGTYLEPLQRGPLGVVANTDAVPTQLSAMFPSKPLEGAPAETAQALTLLGAKDPDVARALVRQHLVNNLNESTQNLQSGPNQFGGARYAATLAGNPEQRATLLAGVGATGGDPEDLNSLLDTFAATGARQRQGSATAFNEQDLSNLHALGAMGRMADSAINPLSIPHRLSDAFERFRLGQNVDALSRALTADPDQSVQALMDARTATPGGIPMDPVARALLALRLSQPTTPLLAQPGP